MTKKETVQKLKDLGVKFNERSTSMELTKLYKETIKEIDDGVFEPIIPETIEEIKEEIEDRTSKKLNLYDVRQQGLMFVCFDGTKFRTGVECSDYNNKVGHIKYV